MLTREAGLKPHIVWLLPTGEAARGPHIIHQNRMTMLHCHALMMICNSRTGFGLVVRLDRSVSLGC